MHPPALAKAPDMGSTVRTPSGRIAIVVAVHEIDREATVQRVDDGEQARFRWSHLKPAGGPAEC